MTKTVYWDSCCFIALIQMETGRHEACRAIYEEAERGDIRILTSALTISEVCRVRCERDKPRSSFNEEHDVYLDAFFDNDFFVVVELSPTIAVTARRLFRAHPEIGKTYDAVHLATALLEGCDEMHTYDHNDLIGLSGQMQNSKGTLMPIGEPKPAQSTLFASTRAE